MTKMDVSLFPAGAITGARIERVRAMTRAELVAEGWTHAQGRGVVLELSNGVLVYPVADRDGNGPGYLLAGDPQGNAFPVQP